MEPKPNQSYDTIVVHYSEIGTKGKNRSAFEQRLVRNTCAKLGLSQEHMHREVGQFIISYQAITGYTHDEIVKRLKNIPGIATFSFAQTASYEIDDITKKALSLIQNEEMGECSSFRILTRRHFKDFPKTSMQVDRSVGEAVQQETGMAVKLRQPDVTVKIEITERAAYVSCLTYDGTGGLPTDTNQKVVSLLSGGIDSPVASYMMMKRGCHVTFVHFQNRNQMMGAVEDKVNQIAECLSQYQINTTLYIVPFETIQKRIIMDVPEELRMIVYRKVMIQIAEQIAEKVGAQALIMGDSVSQVASQTLSNLASTYDSVRYPLLLPVIGLNKQEIIDIATRIGTYDISILPYGDCCSYFLPKHPSVHSKTEEIESYVKDMDLSSIVEEAIENAQTVSYK